MAADLFHARGLVHLGAWAFYERTVPGGLVAVGAALDDEHRDFISQLFLASAWYDVLPLSHIADAVSRILKLPFEKLVESNARFVAERDISTVYRLLLKMSSIEAVMLRLPKASMRYFDFGTSSARMVRPGLCESFQQGIPQPLATWYVACASGFTQVALGLAGARGVHVHADSPVVDGRRGDVQTVTLRFENRWS